jgi:hypothetical protein
MVSCSISTRINVTLSPGHNLHCASAARKDGGTCGSTNNDRDIIQLGIVDINRCIGGSLNENWSIRDGEVEKNLRTN